MLTSLDFQPSQSFFTYRGKEYFISSIGMSKLRFIQKRPIIWKEFDSQGNLIQKHTAKVGALTPPIDNAFFSPSQKIIFVQFSIGSHIYQTEFNPDNFDFTPVESLPVKSIIIKAAEAKADQAKQDSAAAKEDVLSQVTYSIFGTTDIKKPLLIAGGLLAIFIFWDKYLREPGR